jgi:hypothetical protein
MAANSKQPVRFDGKSERDIIIEMWCKLDSACDLLLEHKNRLDALDEVTGKNTNAITYLRAAFGIVWGVNVLVIGTIIAQIIGGKP